MMNVKRIAMAVLLLALLAAGLFSAASCGAVGADIRLENLSIGAINMEGVPIDGLPSDKINIDLNVAAQTIKISTGADGTTLTLLPSEATIVIAGNSVSFEGLKPDQVKVEWVVKPSK